MVITLLLVNMGVWRMHILKRDGCTQSFLTGPRGRGYVKGLR
jgi:hypothetical protein